MEATRPSKPALCAAYAAIYLIWGSSYLAIRYSVNSIPPFVAGGFRFLLAGVLLFAICAVRRVKKSTAAGWRNALFSSLMTFLLANSLLLYAEIHVASSIAALISALEPLWFCLFGWLFFGEHMEIVFVCSRNRFPAAAAEVRTIVAWRVTVFSFPEIKIICIFTIWISQSFLEPFMFVRAVVDDQIHDDMHITFLGFCQ